MAHALRVLTGGKQADHDEAYIEARVVMDETATEALRLYEIAQDLEDTYRIRNRKFTDVRWYRLQRGLGRMATRARAASAELEALMGNGGAA